MSKNFWLNWFEEWLDLIDCIFRIVTFNYWDPRLFANFIHWRYLRK